EDEERAAGVLAAEAAAGFFAAGVNADIRNTERPRHTTVARVVVAADAGAHAGRVSGRSLAGENRVAGAVFHGLGKRDFAFRPEDAERIEFLRFHVVISREASALIADVVRLGGREIGVLDAG